MPEAQIQVPTQAVIEVAARPHPFREAVVTEVRPAGTTLRQIVADLIREPWLRSWAAVSVDGELVHPMYYVRPQGPEYRPKPGRRVTVTVVPQGEGEGKNTAAVILSAVVLIAAAAVTANPQLVAAIGGFVGGGAATGAAIVAAGALGATIAINALLPPPQPKLRDQAGALRVSRGRDQIRGRPGLGRDAPPARRGSAPRSSPRATSSGPSASCRACWGGCRSSRRSEPGSSPRSSATTSTCGC